MLGDSLQQRVQPLPVGLLEVVEHMAQYSAPVARMADAETHPPVILAEQRVDAAQAVVAGGAAALLDAHLTGGEIEFVVEHEDVGRRDLVEARRRADRTAGFVHVCQWFQRQRLAAADPASGHRTVKP